MREISIKAAVCGFDGIASRIPTERTVADKFSVMFP
jgi:hypothetical protein